MTGQNRGKTGVKVAVVCVWRSSKKHDHGLTLHAFGRGVHEQRPALLPFDLEGDVDLGLSLGRPDARKFSECLPVEDPVDVADRFERTQRVVIHAGEHGPRVGNLQSLEMLVEVPVVGERLILISSH